MANQVLPEAFFDGLSLAHKLDGVLDGFRFEEIQLFSYFSSVLFLYKGNPLSEWKFKFVIDSNGYPFSDDLNRSIDRHCQNGFFSKFGDFFKISARGTEEFEHFKGLTLFASREEYLRAACATSIIVPYSDTIRALLRDPELTKSKSLGMERWLDSTTTYQKFNEISEAVGVKAKDLIISAVTWINYVSESEKQEDAQGGRS
jgi:hypothetical protein